MTATNLQVVTAAADDAQTRPHYHPIGITFHWLMAALVFVQLWWGWRTSLLAPGYDKLDAYGVHALVGIAILLLAFLRAGWRMIAPFVLPDLEKPEDLPGYPVVCMAPPSREHRCACNVVGDTPAMERNAGEFSFARA
jgi:hypothetical protein